MGEATETSSGTPIADERAQQPEVQHDLDEKASDKSLAEGGWLRRLIDVVSYVPPNCRYNPEKPFEFSMGLNVLFGKCLSTYGLSQTRH